jgi:hypothetical protein
MHFDKADRLADAIIERVGRDIVLALPLGLGKANRQRPLCASKYRSLDALHLTIFTTLTLEAGKIGKDYELAAVHRENTPERIERTLKPAREQGLPPAFPFGTDFSRTEQRLAEALRRLSISSSMQLLRSMLAGMRAGAPTAEVTDCLARMGLERPPALAERGYRALLCGALGGAPV